MRWAVMLWCRCTEEPGLPQSLPTPTDLCLDNKSASGPTNSIECDWLWDGKGNISWMYLWLPWDTVNWIPLWVYWFFLIQWKCVLWNHRNGGLETSPLIGKFCGSNLPPTIIPSFANALYLKFSTDVSMAFKGFNIEWDGASTGKALGKIISSMECESHFFIWMYRMWWYNHWDASRLVNGCNY